MAYSYQRCNEMLSWPLRSPQTPAPPDFFFVLFLTCVFRLINPVLLKYLQSIKGLIIGEEHIRLLTVDILQKCGDLVVPFMSSLNLQMEPRPSATWFANMTFIIEVCCSSTLSLYFVYTVHLQ